MLNCSVIRNSPVNNKGPNTLFLKIDKLKKNACSNLCDDPVFVGFKCPVRGRQGTTCICEDIAYVAMNPLQQHAERLTDDCCSAFQR